jgi:hypothetical protein
LKIDRPRVVMLTLDTMVMDNDEAGKRVLIRTRYDAAAVIVIRLDAGFFDEKNFRLCSRICG